MRFGILLLLLLAVCGRSAPQPEYVEAVEFPYYLYPRTLWERELVWLKNTGVRTVEFSIPWNWHEVQPGVFDFTGRTSPRRDLVVLIHALRELGLHAWVRPLPPVPEWANDGWPSGPRDSSAQRAWVKALADLLQPQTEQHGGPIAFVEGRELGIDADQPPAPVIFLSAGDSSSLARSREAFVLRRGATVWRDVEPALYPAGWEPPGPDGAASLLRKGAVDLSGVEQASAAGLRRDAALLRNWAAFLPGMRAVSMPRPQSGKLPAGISAAELVSRMASAVSIVNRGESEFHEALRVFDPAHKRVLIIPAVSVPSGESLWLPLEVSLGAGGMCHECSNFSSAERIVYATAELISMEFENGILAMEFAAPEPGEVVLQLAREPAGPLLAAGKPTKFDWDEKTLRARLPIPAGSGADHRVRIGLAIEAPETSAFFSDAHRLIIGEKNVLSTVYSSAEVAARSRLRLPEGFTATASPKSPNEIEYTISVPSSALHGDFVPLALEADGVPLGRARLQLLRPLSIRLPQALELHFANQDRLTPEPFTVPIEPRAGSNLEIVLRNNSLEIRTYRLEAFGNQVEFSPARTEISVAGMEERTVMLRIFGKEGAGSEDSPVCDWHLRVSGGTELELPMRAVLVPRNGTVAWTADLDGDGSPEWVLESAKVRAIFSAGDGGRWIELTWKDTGTNFLPANGVFAQTGKVEVRANGAKLEFTGNGWSRTVSLRDAQLTVEQNTPLPPDSIAGQTIGNVSLFVGRHSPSQVVYELRQMAQGL